MRNCDSLQPKSLDGDALGRDDYSDAEPDDEPVILTEADWAVLAHLENVTMQTWMPPAEEWESDLVDEIGASTADEEPLDEEQSVGFSLHFHFAPNEFLEVDELALYCYATGEVAETTPPLWREGHDVTVRTRTKKIKRKGKGTERVSVAKPVDSFFRIFEAPDDEERIEAAADAGLAPVEVLQEALVMPIKEDLVPHASAYYIRALLDGFYSAEDEREAEEGATA